MNIFQNLLSDSAGRIFLITFASYLFGYLIYGGYLFTFFGRKGSLPFGLSDFSVADLISIFPAAIITSIDFIRKAFIEIVKGAFFQFFLPGAFGLMVWYFLASIGFRLSNFLPTPTLTGYLALTGFIIWFLGFMVSSLHPFKKSIRTIAIVIILEYLGLTFLFATIPTPGESFPIFPVPTDQTQQVLSDVLNTILILEIIVSPYIFGNAIANTAIKSNLLVKIDRLTLRQPILKEGLRKIAALSEAGMKIPIRELWMAQKNLPIDIKPDVYEWSSEPNKVLFLIATFEKFVLIYVPGLKNEDHRTIIINRDIILSMEFANKTFPTNL
jgi:hypothetical protein